MLSLVLSQHSRATDTICEAFQGWARMGMFHHVVNGSILTRAA